MGIKPPTCKFPSADSEIDMSLRDSPFAVFELTHTGLRQV